MSRFASTNQIFTDCWCGTGIFKSQSKQYYFGSSCKQTICCLIWSPTWLTVMTCGSAVSESEVNSVIALTDCDLWLMGWRRTAFLRSLWTDKLPVAGILSHHGWLERGGGGEQRKIRILCHGFTQTWYSYLRRLTFLPLAILWRLSISAPVAHTVVCSGEVKYRLSMYYYKVEWEKMSSCVCILCDAAFMKHAEENVFLEMIGCLLWSMLLILHTFFLLIWLNRTGYLVWKWHWRACGSIMY